jgi:hypothetical protein
MGNAWLGLGRRATANSRWAAVLVGLAAIVPLLSISGCTGMVNGQPRTQSAVKVSPTLVNFGNTGVGKKVSHVATITNTSLVPVTLTEATVSTAEFSVSGLSFPVHIQPGQKTNFTVWFKGSKVGKTTGALTFSTATAGITETAILTGTTGPSEPQLTTSTASYDFGNVQVKTDANLALTITNSGLSDLNISEVNLSGQGYSLAHIKMPFTVPAGATESLNVAFQPKSAEHYSGSLAISSNDPAHPTTIVYLVGVGVAAPVAKLNATPGVVNFSNVQIGKTVSSVTMLKNTGTANVTVSMISINAPGFSTSGIVTPVLMVPGESLPLTVKFSPKSTGATSGVIALSHSDGEISSVSVSGTAVQSALTVSPSTINFGSVVTGITNSQTVQISNPSAVAVNITAANLSGSAFSTTGLNLPLTLNAGQSSTFNVQFSAKTAGATTGSISLVADSATAVPAITLSGTGVTAGLTLTVNPGSVSFGNVTVGSSATRNVTVTNTGNSNVAIASIQLSGASLTLSGGSAVTLSPSQSISLSVQYSPSTATGTSGSISIVSNATGSPAAVAISGTGVAQVQHSVALSWNASSNAASYNVYRSSTSGTGYARLNPGSDTSLSYSDTAVQSSQTYFYVTTAVDNSGTESPFSSEVSATIP